MRYFGRGLVALAIAGSVAYGEVEEKSFGCYFHNSMEGARNVCYDDRKIPHVTFSDVFDGEKPDGKLDTYCEISGHADRKCTWIIGEAADHTYRSINKGDKIRMRDSPDANDLQRQFDQLRAEVFENGLSAEKSKEGK